MPRPPTPRNVADFNQMFPDEEACVAYLAACRWPDGFRCPRCRHRAAFVLPRRRLWQCKSCGHQTSVTAGTIMHRTRTPLLTWFWAAYWMTANRPGLSALQLEHLVGIGRYETAWLILHKLRRAMANANREPLRGTVQVAETFIGGETPDPRGGRRRTGRKSPLVAVAVEVRGERSGQVRAEVIADATDATLSRFIVRNVEQGSTVLSDGNRGDKGHGVVAVQGDTQLPGTQESLGIAGTEDIVPHARDAISSLKTWLHGTHRGVGTDLLPYYLDEFVFRWSRRHAPMTGFRALLGLGTHREPTTYQEILGAPPAPGTASTKSRKTGPTRTSATGDPRPVD